MSGKVGCLPPFAVPVETPPVQYEEGFDQFSEKILDYATRRNLSLRCFVPTHTFFAHTDVYTDLSKKVGEASRGALKLQAKVDISDPEVVTISFKKV